jgi:hypothetical protein
LATAILMGLVVCSLTASAGNITLYTTLGPNNEFDGMHGYGLWNIPSYSENFVIADSFSLSVGATVGDAVLALGNLSGGNSPVNVYIESDNGGLPGSVLASLSQVGTIPPWTEANGGGGLVTFNCTGGSCNLAAGAYWLVANEPVVGPIQVWNFAYQDAAGNIAFNSIGSLTGPWGSFFQTVDGFRIDGPPVPEPGTLAMFGSGIVGLAVMLRRKINL